MFRKVAKFRDVALFTILVGAFIFSFGAVTWYLNIYHGYSFYFPAIKMIGGWIIISLGYIHLNLEFLREKN